MSQRKEEMHAKAFIQLLIALALAAPLSSTIALADPPTTSPAHNIFDFGKPGSETPPADTPKSTPKAAAPVVSPTTVPSSAARKIPVPSDADIAAASKLINELFGDEIARATRPDQKSAVAAELLKTGVEETVSMPGKFVLFCRARDISIEMGDLSAAAGAVNEMGHTFQIDPSKMEIEAAEAISKSPHLDRKRFSADAGAIAADARKADDYDVAEAMDQLALAAARQSGDQQLVKVLSAQLQNDTDARTALAKVKRAQGLLKDKPEDPDANLAVGRYLCFVKGDWKSGLPMLSKSGDAVLAQLAKDEIAGSRSGSEQMKRADRWWDVADREEGSQQLAIREHAAEIYREIEPGLSALNRMRVDKRLAIVPAPAPAVATPAAPAAAAAPSPPKRSAAGVVIVSARWGGGANWADVTKKVTQLITDGTAFWANPGTLGADPTPHWRKHLDITYIKAGKQKSVHFDEDNGITPPAEWP